MWVVRKCVRGDVARVASKCYSCERAWWCYMRCIEMLFVWTCVVMLHALHRNVIRVNVRGDVTLVASKCYSCERAWWCYMRCIEMLFVWTCVMMLHVLHRNVIRVNVRDDVTRVASKCYSCERAWWCCTRCIEMLFVWTCVVMSCVWMVTTCITCDVVHCIVRGVTWMIRVVIRWMQRVNIIITTWSMDWMLYEWYRSHAWVIIISGYNIYKYAWWINILDGNKCIRWISIIVIINRLDIIYLFWM